MISCGYMADKSPHHCNDAALLLLQEKLVDAHRIAQHTISGISHVCVEKSALEEISQGIEKQLTMLNHAIEHPATLNRDE